MGESAPAELSTQWNGPITFLKLRLLLTSPFYYYYRVSLVRLPWPFEMREVLNLKWELSIWKELAAVI